MYRKNVLTNEQRADIIEKYQTGNYTCSALAKEYGVWPNAINGMFRRKGIQIFNDGSSIRRKYTLNEQYFDKIDTEDKAYFLGLLFADGCNDESKNTILMGLQEEDKNILEIFKERINSNKPLYYRSSRINISIGNNKSIQSKPSYVIVIISKNISNKLSLMGCVSRKSLILKFPTEDVVPPHLVRHFIRGYFDGDGCFYISRPKNYKWNNYGVEIMSTKIFCNSMSKIINDTLNITSKVNNLDLLKYKPETKRLRISGVNNVLTFLDWLYYDSTVYLERKYNKYLGTKNMVKNNVS